MAVQTVHRGDDHDTAEGIARVLAATGHRVVAAHWFGEHVVFNFDGMTEEEIDAWLDAEWDRVDALRAAGARS